MPRAALRVVDLSHGFRAGMPAYGAGWYPRFELRSVMTPESDPADQGRTFSQFHMNPHNATHIDAPSHFFPGAAGIADLAPEVFFGPALVLNLSHIQGCRPITAGDLAAAAGADVLAGARLLVRTDHLDRRWGAPDFWQEAPYLDAGAAGWCVDQEVTLVGLDCLTEEPGDRAFPVHRRLLGAGIPILEYLCHLADLRQRWVGLAALPVLVHGAEAAPARAVAWEGGNGDDGP